MNLASGQYLQLIIALFGGGMLFLVAYMAPVRVVMWVLLLLIPFPLIDSIYGSINMVLTYMVSAAFLLRGRIIRLPLLGAVVFIMFAYMLSFSQAFPGTLRDHGLYMIAIISNFTLFYLVYNYVRTSGSFRDMWNILAVMNVLVLLYCALEIAVGVSGVQIFGLSELTVRSHKSVHLQGPFHATGLTAEYLAIQSLICLYALMRLTGSRVRMFWLIMLSGNLAFLVATASRGGIVALVLGLIVFLTLFRKEIGALKLMRWSLVGLFLFVVSSTIIVQYTQYNIMFERLEGTEFKGLVPDSRQGWYGLWDEVVAKPVFGHGPRLRLYNESSRNIRGYTPIPYPHSAYLYLIYTVGFFGLFAYLLFFFLLALQYWKGGRITRVTVDPFLRGLPLLGLVVLVVFAASQVRMEMFRYILHAYQQYLFMLTGAFLAFSHLAMNRGRVGRSVAEFHDNKDAAAQRVLRYKRIETGR